MKTPYGSLVSCCVPNTEEIKKLVNSMIPRDVSYGCMLSKEGSSAWAQQSMSKFRRAEIETTAHGVTETEAIGICHSEETSAVDLQSLTLSRRTSFQDIYSKHVNMFVSLFKHP